MLTICPDADVHAVINCNAQAFAIQFHEVQGVPSVAVKAYGPTAAADNSSNSATVTTATLQAPTARATNSSNNKLQALVTSAWRRKHGLSAEGNMHCVLFICLQQTHKHDTELCWL
jgi:hypothetical protein